MYGNFKIFAGSSHPDLAKNICANLGIALGQSRTLHQADETMEVQILENVREADVFVIQTAASPLHTHLFELFMMIDALKGASAGRVTAVIPYLPYVRSDRKDKPRISIAARLVADLLTASGADRILTMDLHAPQVQGFFRVPADQLQAASLICAHLRTLDLSNAVLVAADAGEAKDLGRYANRLDLPIAIIDRRPARTPDAPEHAQLIGDVRGKLAILVDDEINTGRTLASAASFLRDQGAADVKAVATHASFSDDALTRMAQAPLSEIIVTDTVPQPPHASSKVTVLPVARTFAQTIQRIHDGNSVSALFR